MNTQNTMASSYHSKTKFTQKMGIPLLTYLELSFHVLVKAKFFSDSNPTNLVNIKR